VKPGFVLREKNEVFTRVARVVRRNEHPLWEWVAKQIRDGLGYSPEH
jgi:hypothetical protein